MATVKLKWGESLPSALVLSTAPDKASWRNASVEQRERWRDALFVPYPLVEGALGDAWRKIEIARSAKRPTVMLVIGETGSGKTTFANVLVRGANTAFGQDDPERTVVPALLIAAPDPCTPQELCIHILEELGDPISAFRRHVAQCDCGHPFALTRARPPSFPHQVIWKVLQVGRESPEAVSAFAAATARDIDAVCLIQYLAYAAGPGWLGTGRPKKPRIADAWVSEQQLESASAWFADWPASFETRYAGLMLDRRARGDRALPDVITLIRSFPALNSVIDDLIARRRHAAWWLPARYGKQQASIAAMFCPLCLQLDAVPHYRLGWRLAFNYACAAHGVLLHESCGNCAAPPWPAGCGVADRISSRFTSFDVCWKCGQAPAATSHKQAIQQDLPNSWLTEGYAQIGEAMVPSSEAFAALRALCQLFVRKDTRALIASGRGPCAEAARLLGGEDDLRSIELASVRIRAAVIPASLGLLVKWPQVFIDFTAEVGISRMHFNASYQSHPAWFNDCLRNHLARQNRWVTPEMIRSTARQILVAGGIPTKAAIRQKLAWQGDISDELMPPAA